MGRVSGPVLDRIDLCVELRPVDVMSLQSVEQGESSGRIRERVKAARELQKERFRGTQYRFNSDIQASDVERFCHLNAGERACMERLYKSLSLSARAFHRVLKTARTIADLEGSENILEDHLLEAAFYRPSQEYWG